MTDGDLYGYLDKVTTNRALMVVSVQKLTIEN